MMMSSSVFVLFSSIITMMEMLEAGGRSPKISTIRREYRCGTLIYPLQCRSDRLASFNDTFHTQTARCGWIDQVIKSAVDICQDAISLDSGSPMVNLSLQCDYYWQSNSAVTVLLNTSLVNKLHVYTTELQNCTWPTHGFSDYENRTLVCQDDTSPVNGTRCTLSRELDNASEPSDGLEPQEIPNSILTANPLYVFLMVLNLTISLAGILIHFAVFILVPSMRNLPGKMLTSLCIALNGAYVSFIFIRLGSGNCKMSSGIMHYCFLASFFWMNSMAFDICWTFRKATSEMRVATGPQWRKFAIYSAYSWLLPLPFVVAPSIALDPPGEMAVHERTTLSLREGVLICSIGNSKALLLCLVVPVTIVMLVNVTLSVVSAATIIRSTQGGALGASSGSSARYNLKLCFRLSLFVGITWILGIFAHFYNVKPLQYIFSLLNSLQGFFLFLAFTCTKKVYRYIFDKVLRIRKKNRGLPLTSSVPTD